MRRVVQLALLAIIAALVGTPPLVAQDEPAVAIRFLTQKEAAVAIVDEATEPYFSLMQPAEMLAKTSVPLEATDLVKQRDECRQRYRDAAREFTDDEKAAVTDAVNEIHDALKSAYPLVADTPWNFIKLDPSIEGGFPFTHGACIVLPDWVAVKMAQLAKAKQHPARSRFGEILLHEQCHVVQRAHAALFADLYVNVWGFVRAKGLPSCPWLDRVQILDPDGVDTGWVFPSKSGATTTYWQPLVTLDPDAKRPRMPKDFVVVGVALDRKGASFVPRVPKDAKDGKPEMRELELVEGYTAAFGRVPENFHPNETCAVMFSWLAMQEHVAREGPGLVSHAEVDFTKFRAWCRAKLHK
jgi:hypothetical protein